MLDDQNRTRDSCTATPPGDSRRPRGTRTGRRLRPPAPTPAFPPVVHPPRRAAPEPTQLRAPAARCSGRRQALQSITLHIPASIGHPARRQCFKRIPWHRQAPWSRRQAHSRAANKRLKRLKRIQCVQPAKHKYLVVMTRMIREVTRPRVEA